MKASFTKMPISQAKNTFFVGRRGFNLIAVARKILVQKALYVFACFELLSFSQARHGVLLGGFQPPCDCLESQREPQQQPGNAPPERVNAAYFQSFDGFRFLWHRGASRSA